MQARRSKSRGYLRKEYHSISLCSRSALPRPKCNHRPTMTLGQVPRRISVCATRSSRVCVQWSSKKTRTSSNSSSRVAMASLMCLACLFQHQFNLSSTKTMIRSKAYKNWTHSSRTSSSIWSACWEIKKKRSLTITAPSDLTYYSRAKCRRSST